MEHDLNSAEISIALEIAIKALPNGQEAFDNAVTQVVADRDKSIA